MIKLNLRYLFFLLMIKNLLCHQMFQSLLSDCYSPLSMKLIISNTWVFYLTEKTSKQYFL
jgi:hypothetical protein